MEPIEMADRICDLLRPSPETEGFYAALDQALRELEAEEEADHD